MFLHAERSGFMSLTFLKRLLYFRIQPSRALNLNLRLNCTFNLTIQVIKLVQMDLARDLAVKLYSLESTMRVSS